MLLPEELLQQMCQAAEAIGNNDLENKLAEGNIKVIGNWKVIAEGNYFKGKGKFITIYKDGLHKNWGRYDVLG